LEGDQDSEAGQSLQFDVAFRRVIQAIKGETILASSLNHEWPQKLSPEWLLAGMAEQRRAGLPRALFCVRLLKLEQQCRRIKGSPSCWALSSPPIWIH